MTPLEQARLTSTAALVPDGSVLRWARGHETQERSRLRRLAGVSRATWSRYEQGRPTPMAWTRLCTALEACPIMVLPANRAGRDFVAGDLHGQASMLETMLARLCFDPGCDRLILTGDLIDRGPDSMTCLRFLLRPGVFSVLGNHEHMMLDALFGHGSYGPPGASLAFWVKNGGRWVLGLDQASLDDLRHDLLPRVRLLPRMLIIGSGPSRYQVVHAEICSDGQVMDRDLDTAYQQCASLAPSVHEGLIWGRGLIHRLRRAPVPGSLEGLSPTYVGHNVVDHVFQAHGHVFLDTGASLGGTLTLAEVDLDHPDRFLVHQYHR